MSQFDLDRHVVVMQFRDAVTATRRPRAAYFRPTASSGAGRNAAEDGSESESKSESSSSSSSGTVAGRAPSSISSSEEEQEREHDSIVGPRHWDLSTSPFPSTTNRSNSPHRPLGTRTKISQSLLLTRSHLTTQSFSLLATSLSVLLGYKVKDLLNGCFIPILARLIDDLRQEVGRKEWGEKEVRRSLSKEEAKGLLRLRKRWILQGGNGEENGLEEEIRRRMEWNPSSVPSSKNDALETKFLNSLEALLLNPLRILPRLDLSNISLATEDLQVFEGMRQMEKTVEWYLSFEDPLLAVGGDVAIRAREVVKSVRSLNLSRNRLERIPNYLFRLFPKLQSLNVSHNQLVALSPLVITLSELRRLKIKDNLFEGKKWRSNAMGLGTSLGATNNVGEGDRVREVTSLSTIAMLLLRLPSALKEDEEEILLHLPPHLLHLLLQSYICCSCRHFIRPDEPKEWIEPLRERVHFMNPPFTLPPLNIQVGTTPSTTNARRGLRWRGGEMMSGGGEGGEMHPHRLRLEEKILLNLLARGTELKTYIISDPPPTTLRSLRSEGMEEGQCGRYCRSCLGRHLRIQEAEGAEQCGCAICKEEERVMRGERAGVVRWLRRSDAL